LGKYAENLESLSSIPPFNPFLPLVKKLLPNKLKHSLPLVDDLCKRSYWRSAL